MFAAPLLYLRSRAPASEQLPARLKDQLPSVRAQRQARMIEEQETKEEESLDHIPIVVLSSGQGRWNTGVWTGFGEKQPTLNWAAAGVVVDKSACRFECEFTHDQSKLATADAVLMELVNHPKFLGEGTAIPIPWPAKRVPSDGVPTDGLPLVGNFFFEPSHKYPKYTTDPSLHSNVDFTVAPDRQVADIPITLICPWGHPRNHYLNKPPAKAPGNLLGYFNEHGFAPEYADYVRSLFSLLGDSLHSYIHMGNRQMPPEAIGEPYRLENRLKFMGTYKFLLVTEPLLQDDWIEPDWSQTLLAGAVPVYIGAPNIREYTPGPKSYIDIRDFPDPQALVDKLRELDANDDAYMRYFDWKSLGLSDKFQTHLSNCAHYAECRICEFVRRRVAAISRKTDAAVELLSQA